MNEKTLLVFAKRIFNSGSTAKALLSLRQLKALLNEQGAPAEYIQLIDQMMESAPEMQTISQKAVLTQQDVLIAKTRAEERKRREEAARRYGRC